MIVIIDYNDPCFGHLEVYQTMHLELQAALLGCEAVGEEDNLIPLFLVPVLGEDAQGGTYNLLEVLLLRNEAGHESHLNGNKV